MPYVNGLVTSAVFNKKIRKVVNKYITMTNILLLMILINFQMQ